MLARGAALLVLLLATLALPAVPRAEDPQGAAVPVEPSAAGPTGPTLDRPKLTVDLGTAAAITGAELGVSAQTSS
jgi:hypothetical protein